MKIIFSIIFIFLIYSSTFSQKIKRVLFLGNSYTYVNNLPQTIAFIAQSKGDSLIFDANTPGGYTLQQHSQNVTSLNKIESGEWDYVVLQEQSQLPSFSPEQVQTEVYPFADLLNQKIKNHDSCTRTIFYMTWGRKNGDQTNCASYPPVCTYEGMQQRLRESYLEMSNTLNAEVAPIGMSWKKTRNNNPAIELYSADESHPSIAGTYLAACTFYASLFHKSPIGSSYIPTGISESDAVIIQQNASSTVFDSISIWNIDTTKVISDFFYTTNLNQISFTNLSYNATDFVWDFGDGTTSTLENPTHTYTTNNNFTVTLTCSNECLIDSTKHQISITTNKFNNTVNKPEIKIFPNPTNGTFTIENNFQPITEYAIHIFDLLGRTVFKSEISESNKVEIRLNLTGGIYTLQISNKTAKTTFRLLINK